MNSKETNMHKTLTSAIAFTLSMAVSTPALAWEPMPDAAIWYTSVVRVLDTSLVTNGTKLLVALSDPPAGVCIANQARWGMDTDGVQFPAYGENWIVVQAVDVGKPLAFLMAAKAQNLTVRVVMVVERGQPCRITDMRTCTDATACAVPGLPGN